MLLLMSFSESTVSLMVRNLFFGGSKITVFLMQLEGGIYISNEAASNQLQSSNNAGMLLPQSNMRAFLLWTFVS